MPKASTSAPAAETEKKARSEERTENLPLSSEQKACVDSVMSGNHTVINAVAGSGKSHTIKACVLEILKRRPDSKVLIVAFGLKNVKDMQAWTDANCGKNHHVENKTLHALGQRMFGVWNPELLVRVERDKKLLLARKIANNKSTINILCAIATKGQNTLRFQSCIGDTALQEEAKKIIQDFGIFVPADQLDFVINLVPKLMRMIEMNISMFDHDDQIYFPNLQKYQGEGKPLDGSFKYDWIIVDEAQDVNAAQRGLVNLILKDNPEARMIVAGDPHQAIYGFRGADSLGIETIIADLERRGGTVCRCLLSMSYRCPKKVAEKAKMLVDHFRAIDNAPEGLVQKCTEDEALNLIEADQRDLVLAKENKPMIKMAFKLIQEKKQAVCILGEDSLKDQLLEFIGSESKETIEELHKRSKSEEKRQRSEAGDDNFRRNFIKTMHDFLRDISQGAGSHARNVYEQIENAFRSSEADENVEKKEIRCSTIHKAKGLESKRVFLLNSSGNFARSQSRNTGPPRADPQVANVLYVAITRSLQELYTVDCDVDTLISNATANNPP